MEARRSHPVLVLYATIDTRDRPGRQKQNADFTRIPICPMKHGAVLVAAIFPSNSNKLTETQSNPDSASRRSVGQRVDDAVDDLLDQHLIVALPHDTDHG